MGVRWSPRSPRAEVQALVKKGEARWPAWKETARWTEEAGEAAASRSLASRQPAAPQAAYGLHGSAGVAPPVFFPSFPFSFSSGVQAVWTGDCSLGVARVGSPWGLRQRLLKVVDDAGAHGRRGCTGVARGRIATMAMTGTAALWCLR
jgi:hypothetical protein